MSKFKICLTRFSYMEEEKKLLRILQTGTSLSVFPLVSKQVDCFILFVGCSLQLFRWHYERVDDRNPFD